MSRPPWYLCLIGSLLLSCGSAAAQREWPESWPFENVQSSVDQRDCLNISASALVDVGMDELFDEMSQPEKVGVGRGGPRLVFVAADDPNLASRRNAGPDDPWVIKRPYAKILQLSYHFGRMNAPGMPSPEAWVEFIFSRQTHSVHEEWLKSTLPGPTTSSIFSLSVENGGAATRVAYQGSQCLASVQEKDQLTKWQLQAAGQYLASSRLLYLESIGEGPGIRGPTGAPRATPQQTPVP